MSYKRTHVIPIVVLLGSIVSICGAPIAAADGADSTIAELKAQGYTVDVNWINGATESLSYCTVVNVNDPNSTPHPPSSTTLYVDVSCPDHQN